MVRMKTNFIWSNQSNCKVVAAWQTSEARVGCHFHRQRQNLIFFPKIATFLFYCILSNFIWVLIRILFKSFLIKMEWNCFFSFIWKWLTFLTIMQFIVIYFSTKWHSPWMWNNKKHLYLQVQHVSVIIE